MTVYLGTLGRMVELYSTTGTSVTGIPERTYKTTLEGRVKVQVQPAGRRSWSMTADQAYPLEQAAIMGFASGEWGNGPFVWVSPDAPVTNLLTPAAASCAPGAYVLGSGVTAAVAGPMLTPDGWAGRSYSKGTQNSLFFGADRSPVLQGRKVTASAYVLGAGAKVGIAWYDSAGLAVGTTATSTASGTAGTVTRSSVTAMPPVDAVSCRPYVNSPTTKTARPALTWTDWLVDFADGQGCPKAIIDNPHRELVKARNSPGGGRWSDMTFTIQEVG